MLTAHSATKDYIRADGFETQQQLIQVESGNQQTIANTVRALLDKTYTPCFPLVVNSLASSLSKSEKKEEKGLGS